jgi:EAL domain-containing protein (putative c-di-GMP-specific phosphodiesterase class I)
MSLFNEATADNSEDLARWHELEYIMSNSLKYNYFHMVYQPLVSLNTGGLIGFESLIRCESEQFGIVGPDEFIPHVEQTGMILELGEWIFEQTMRDLQQMMGRGLDSITVSLNISPVQIHHGNVFNKVMSLLDKYAIPATAIKIELTETALIHNPAVIAKVLEDFHREGVGIWLDDFGTGYASLGLLRQFHIDGLKVDRSFVSNITENNEDFTLCSAILAMAQRLGLATVAEGIEYQSQLQILEQLGCNIAQGYLLGKPQNLKRSMDTWMK